MKQKVAKNFLGASVSVVFGVLATAVVTAHDISNLVDASSVNDALFDGVSFDKKLNNFDCDIQDVSEDSLLPILFRGDLSPANAAFTITRPGVYRLTSAKSASGVPNITITASNVTLDLGGNTLTGGTNGVQVTGNNVTILNGTVTGMTQNGVFIQGSGCRVDNCDFLLGGTGVTLQNANECVIENCRVRNVTQAGVSLQRTWTSSVRSCEIISINGGVNVYGVVAKNGGNNSVTQCVIQDLQTNSSTVGAEVAGILLDNEVASNAQDNQIGAVVSLTTTAAAYGVLTRMSLSNAAKIPGQPLLAGTNAQVAFDGSGNAFSVWEQGTTTQIYSSQYVMGLGWRLTSTLPGQNPSVASTVPQVAVDQFGNAISVWIQSDGVVNKVYWSRYSVASAVWSDAAQLPNQPAFAATVPQIAIDQDGNAIAVWVQSGGAGDRVYWSRYSVTAAVWSDAVQIPNQIASTATVPQIAIDQDGNAIAVWIQNLRPYWSKYTATSSVWTNAVLVQAASITAPPRIDIDQDGNVIAVWSQSSRIYWSKYTATSSVWSTAVQIPNQPALTASVSQIAIDPLGNAIAVWLAGNNIYWSRYTAASAVWSDTALLPNQTATAGATPQVAVDKNGNAIAVWRQSNRIWWSRYTANLGWSNVAQVPAQLVQTAILPQVSVDTFGNAIVVWTQSDGSRNQIYWSSYTSGTSWVTGTAITGVSSLDGDGVGICASNRYVASNVAYDCDSAFIGVSTEFIDSQANARGVDNIDTNLTTSDSVPLIVDQAYTIESKLDAYALVSDSATIESKLDYLMACDYDALPAPTTLSTDYGAYCLSADMSGDLAITGSGITLCLNGHTISGGTNGILVSGDEVIVKNGTVKSATASGIKLTGDKCTLQDIVSVGNVTGFELSGADNCTITNCSALDNSREGFLLTNAQKNNVTACQAINTSGAGVIAGFKTTSGVGNSFVDCSVNGVVSSNTNAFGVLGQGENKTKFDNCSIMNITTTCYGAGIALIGDYLATPTANDFVFFDAGRFSRFPNWLNTSVGSYLTMGGLGNYKIIKFNPTATTSLDALTTVTVTPSMSSGVRTSAWLSWHNKQYLAVSGDNDAGNDIVIYDFNLASGTVTTVTSYSHHPTESADGCDWVVSDTLAYLIYTADTSTSNEITSLRFDGSNLIKTSGLEYASNLLSVRAHTYKGKNRLFVTVFNTDPDILVYGFNDINGSELLEKLPATYTISGGFADVLTPFDFDGETYVAFGVSAAASPTVRVLKYTENPTSQFELFATYDYGPSVAAVSVDALVTGTTVYLAVGGNKAGEYTKILTFDPYQPTVTTRIQPFYNLSAETTPAGYYTSGVSWNRCPGVDNKIFLAAAKEIMASQPCLHVFGFNFTNQSQLNLVSDCMLSGVPAGDGVLLDEVINAAYDNTTYNCQEGFVSGVRTDYTVPQFATSNREVS
jgi:parallel beta-helix repeat protein